MTIPFPSDLLFHPYYCSIRSCIPGRSHAALVTTPWVLAEAAGIRSGAAGESSEEPEEVAAATGHFGKGVVALARSHTVAVRDH